ncbi:Formate hydrogenlyase transcriptional activator [compost metagenome]
MDITNTNMSSGNTNDVFLQLNLDFLRIRSPKQLIHLFNNRLKDLFGYRYATIFLKSPDSASLFNCLSEWVTEKQQDPFSRSVLLNFLDQMGNNSQPGINFGLIQPVFVKEIKPYLSNDQQQEKWKALTLDLYDGEKLFGQWVMLYEKNEIIADDYLEKLPIVAALIGVSLLNIIYYKEGLEREMASDVIQSLNIDFAAIREKKDLLKIIHFKLKNLFDFSDHFVAVINDDQLTLSSFLQDTRSWADEHPQYRQSVEAKYPLNDGIFNKVILSKEPQVFDLHQQSLRGNMPEYFQILYNSGIKKVFMIGLHVGDKMIGLWCICQIENQYLNREQLLLIKQISSQLSIAVENIKSNETLAVREKEARLLQRLSEDIANIRNRNGLFSAIDRNLRNLFNFEEILIMLINKDQTYHAFLNSIDYPEAGSTYYQKEALKRDVSHDCCLSKVMQSEGIVVLNMKQLCDDGRVPDYIKMEYENGIKEKIAIRLRDNEKDIGAFFINAAVCGLYSDHQLELIEGISYQLSIAISNILANEEIATREEERELLLSISIDIAVVRNQQELVNLITQRLKKQLPFSHILIGTINSDESTFSAYIIDPSSQSKAHPQYNQARKMKFLINDGIIDRVCESDLPLVFDLTELSKQADAPPYIKINYECGLEQVVITKFSKGGKVFGFWFIFLNKSDLLNKIKLSLIAGLSNQIAIAVSNIMANEKILSQLEVIQNYKQQLEDEKIYLKEEIETTHNYSEIIGNGPEMQKIFHLVSKVASTDSTVLILGETGTGKELIARAIHNNSPRRNNLMIKVNCATLPVHLIESELFGHERGSFTGATERRIGKFELANNGTLFLDEIGELPLELQVKLLRVLQEREVERIGGKATIKVNVRVIAATNRNLHEETAKGRFRRDLYYRINIFPINLPPLRSRIEDIPLLTSHFIQRFSKKLGRQINKISTSLLQELQHYSWPGNIRELEHLIERSILLTTGDVITHVSFPSREIQEAVDRSEEYFSIKTIEENERDHILSMLKYCNGKIAGEGGAAQRLGVPASTLGSKIKRLGIRKEHFRE